MEPDFPEVCQRLWENILKPDNPEILFWMPLFQAFVLENPELWLVRMRREVEVVASQKILSQRAALLKFEGSLVIFRYPELTPPFPERAKSWEGNPFTTVKGKKLLHIDRLPSRLGRYLSCYARTIYSITSQHPPSGRPKHRETKPVRGSRWPKPLPYVLHPQFSVFALGLLQRPA